MIRYIEKKTHAKYNHEKDFNTLLESYIKFIFLLYLNHTFYYKQFSDLYFSIVKNKLKKLYVMSVSLSCLIVSHYHRLISIDSSLELINMYRP